LAEALATGVLDAEMVSSVATELPMTNSMKMRNVLAADGELIVDVALALRVRLASGTRKDSRGASGTRKDSHGASGTSSNFAT
jgi:hypothetical protein